MLDIKLEQSVLSMALNLINMAVEKRKTDKSIINNILFELDDDVLKLTGTDLEVQMSSKLSFEGSGDENFTVSAFKLTGIVNALPDNSIIRLRITDNKLLLTSKKSRFNLMMLPAKDFPNVEDKSESENGITLEQQQVKQLLDSVKYCISDVPDVRTYLNGVLFHIKGKEIVSVATNGHRLSCERIDVETNYTEKQHIIPKKTVGILSKLLKPIENTITLNFTENHLSIKTPRLEFYSKLISGHYPNYEQVIPNHYDKKLTVNTQDFKTLLKMASSFSSEDKKAPIALDIENGVLKSKIQSEQEEHIDQLDVDSNESITIKFNLKYLLEATNKVHDDKMNIKFSNSSPSTIIEDMVCQNTTTVIMPMRV